MLMRHLFPFSGYLLYLHILPKHFGKNFVANFGPEAFTFLINCSHPQPHLKETLVFSRCGAIKTAVVVSITPTATWDKEGGITTHEVTVHAHLTDDTIVDEKTMNWLITKKGWKFLGTDGKVHTHH
jgi:hypothetical protein